MSKSNETVLLEDIVKSIEKIELYTTGIDNYKQLISDDQRYDAVIRNFEIIGEASKQLPEIFKNQHNNIPWNKAIGLRNRLIHEYFGINEEIIWNTIVYFLPQFKIQINSLIIS